MLVLLCFESISDIENKCMYIKEYEVMIRLFIIYYSKF